MRQIGSIPQEEEARVFGDYLLTLGIGHSVEASEDGWAIWVENDDHLERAGRELEEFGRSPDDPRYRDAAPKASALRVGRERKKRNLRAKYVDVRTSWAGGVQGAQPLTMVLILVCLAVGAASWFGRDWRVLEYLWISSLPKGATLWDGLWQIRHGQVWRLVSPIFIHYGVMHLVFNMLWLLDLGSMIERRKGTWMLLALVLVSAIPSNVAQYVYAGTGAGGMSGVVYALFGYVWMKSRYQPHEQMHLNENTVLIMIGWLLICMTGWVGRIANTAHVAGLVIGVAAGIAPHLWHRLRRRM